MGKILLCCRSDYPLSKIIDKQLRKLFEERVLWAGNREEMENLLKLHQNQIEWVIFPFWSWIIAQKIIDNYKCISFHLGDLPKDRGGSPIQNQIMAGRTSSVLCAFKTSKEMDAGPVYMKKLVSLDGDLEDIHKRIALLVPKMVMEIIKKNITPSPQIGESTYFERRKPEQSEIKVAQMTSCDIYNLIRALNMPPYPPAFLVGKDGKKVFILKAKLEE